MQFFDFLFLKRGDICCFVEKQFWLLLISCSPEEELPMTQAGCLSQMTYSWQTSMMWNIYRKGIQCIAHMGIGDTEKAKPNADRLASFSLVMKEFGISIK